MANVVGRVLRHFHVHIYEHYLVVSAILAYDAALLQLGEHVQFCRKETRQLPRSANGEPFGRHCGSLSKGGQPLHAAYPNPARGDRVLVATAAADVTCLWSVAPPSQAVISSLSGLDVLGCSIVTTNFPLIAPATSR